jgi:hypothetical protein
MTEYVDPDNECPRVYHCRLCKQFNSCSSVMEHLCGYNHRVRYIVRLAQNIVMALNIKQIFCSTATQISVKSKYISYA